MVFWFLGGGKNRNRKKGFKIETNDVKQRMIVLLFLVASWGGEKKKKKKKKNNRGYGGICSSNHQATFQFLSVNLSVLLLFLAHFPFLCFSLLLDEATSEFRSLKMFPARRRSRLWRTRLRHLQCPGCQRHHHRRNLRCHQRQPPQPQQESQILLRSNTR